MKLLDHNDKAAVVRDIGHGGICIGEKGEKGISDLRLGNSLSEETRFSCCKMANIW
jgi:hypothetical protein